MNILQEQYADYFNWAAKVFRVLAWIYVAVGVINLLLILVPALSLTVFGGSPGVVVGAGVSIFSVVITIINSALIVFVLYTIAKVLDFLADLALVADDTRKRVETIRRSGTKDASGQSAVPHNLPTPPRIP